MKNRLILSLVVVLLCVGLTSAQEVGTPITPDNAADLQPLSAVGSALPSTVAYSPDGRYILAATTDYTAVYRADDLTIAPKIYPFTEFRFNPAGELIADGHRWNLDTGLKTGIAAGTRILPPSEESPTTIIEITKPGGETILIDTDSDHTVRDVVINPDGTIAAVVVQEPTHAPFLRLYRLSDGYLYASIPQEKSDYHDMFFRTGTASSREMLVVITRDPYRYEFELHINLYYSESAQLLSEYSGISYGDVQFNADKSLFAYDLDGDRVIISFDGKFLEIDGERLTKDDSFNFLSDVSGQNLLIRWQGATQADIYQFDSDDNLIQRPSLPEPFSYGYWQFLRESWVVFITPADIYLWNIADADAAPRRLGIEVGYPLEQTMISPDGRRLAYISDDETRRVLYDLESEVILTDAPIEAVMNPDWSSLSYWEHGKLIVRDLNIFTDTILEVLPTYVGAVVDIDFATGKAAFSGETFSVIRVSNGRELALPPLDTVPYGAEFVRDGKAIVVFSEQVEEREEYTYWNEYIFEEGLIEGLTYRDYGASRNFKMSPQGRYIISYYSYCDSPYVAPETHIAPFADVNIPLPEGVPSSGTIVSGCGANSAAFVLDESLFYGVNGNRLTRFEPKESEDDLFWWGTDLMYYDYQADRSHSFTYSLSLSPDEQSVALFVEHYQTVDLFDGYTTLQLEGYSIELFELNSLPASQQRDDAIPKLIIPDAKTAVFSPDSQLIVTDVGLYSFEEGLLSAEADGTISAFNPDSTLLATYQDGAVTLWDVRDAESARYPLAQYQISGVTELGFSSDTRRLYVVRAGEVQVWGIEAP